MQIMYTMIQHWFKWSAGTPRNQLTTHRNIAYGRVRDPNTSSTTATTYINNATAATNIDDAATGTATSNATAAQNPGFCEQENVYAEPVVASVHQQVTRPNSHHAEQSLSYGYTAPRLMGFESGQSESELDATAGISSNSLTSLTQQSSQGSRNSSSQSRGRSMGKLGHHLSKIKRLSPAIRSLSNGSRSDVHSYVNMPNIHGDLIASTDSEQPSRRHTSTERYDRMTS